MPSPDPAKPSRSEALSREAQRMGWLYATAINFAGSVAVFTVLGYLLDRWQNTGPWGLVGGLVLGLVGGTIKFIRDGLAISKKTGAEVRGRFGWKDVGQDEEPAPSPDRDNP